MANGGQSRFLGRLEEVRARGRPPRDTSPNVDERFLRAILDSISEAVIAVDMRGIVIYVNGPVEPLLGVRVALGDDLMERLRQVQILTPDGLTRAQIRSTPLPRALRGLATPATDFMVKSVARPEGAQLSSSGSPVVDEQGQLIGGVLVLRDYERQHAEREALIADAGRKSVELTLTSDALRSTEEQLRHAQKMEAVGRLAGGVAHDFNNLLSVILGYTKLALADLDADDPIAADLAEVETAATRAAELTRQLLAFGRKQVFTLRVVDLNEVLFTLHRMLTRVVGEDVEVRLVQAPRLAPVKVDVAQIEQIVLNLVVNARDAMPRGGKLTIETQNIELGDDYAAEHVDVVAGPHVMLAVSDTVEGMDEATRLRIFEPFFTTKELGKGTGLGLSTVFGIVQQSGGTIWVYSEPNVGTTFKIYFPTTDEAAEAIANTPPGIKRFRGTETLLVVEDDPQVRALTCGILKRHGYQILEAENADEALLLCERFSGKIHLLLSDVVLPKMNGGELAARLAALRPDMKRLFMSGYTENSIVDQGVLDPNVAFVQKPIAPEVLLAKIRDVLEPGGPSSTPGGEK
jgi:two-component system cell cycle sensor histidine kinase/response regulator CckA